MYKGYFYILYFYDSDLPAAIIESTEEMQKFLGHKNLNTTRSALSHLNKGDNKYLRDLQNRRFTAYKIMEK